MTRCPKKIPLTLANLIDLEVQLRQDQALDREALQERDMAIGQKIEADKLQSPDVFLAWFAELRGNLSRSLSRSIPSTGERVTRLIHLFGILLFVCGLLLGLAVMAGWLAFDTQRHINILFFWTTIVGLQILLLVVWLFAALPSNWLAQLPGAGSLQMLCRTIGRIPPALLRWGAARISPDYRRATQETADDLKRIHGLYGNLQRWILIRMTQEFALGFNVAAILAFVALTYGNDPTFGWRSTMLSSEQMHGITDTIALPWSRVWPEAVPTLDQVEYVKDSSKENIRLTLSPEQRIRDLGMWASLWPFLLASLLCYGLFPRLLTWLFSVWQVKRNIARSRFDHYAAATLLRRMRRARVASGCSETMDEDHAESAERQAEIPQSTRSEHESVPVLKWAGVDIDRDEISLHLTSRFGLSVAWIAEIGQLDLQGDDEALSRFTKSGDCRRVVLLVEAWEPPDADYLDFLKRLRQTVGDGALIDVLLYNHHGPGVAAACKEHHVSVWRQQLATLGDSRLAVDQLIEPDEARAGEDL